MFLLTKDPIDKAAFLVDTEESGACSSFSGIVRKHNAKKTVRALRYEVYENLAKSEGQKIVDEARALFLPHKIYAVHRSGLLNIGELAVFITASASHRDAAFACCRYIIEQIKKRLPIWKEEFYSDGSADWTSCHEHESTKRVMAKDKVLVVGVGGLGCNVLPCLLAADIKNILIMDADFVEPKNIKRQFLYRCEDIGKTKVEAALERLRTVNKSAKLDGVFEKISRENAVKWVQNSDLVLNCSDNFACAFSLNDACVQAQKPFISGAIAKEDGTIFVYTGENGCLRCLWPKACKERWSPKCGGSLLWGARAMQIAAMQAEFALRLLQGEKDIGGMYLIASSSTQKIKVQKNPSCLFCKQGQIASTIEEDIGLEIDPEKAQGLRIIDIREESETSAFKCEWLPASKISYDWAKEQGKLVLACENGLESAVLASHLQSLGLDRVFSLKGGLHSRL